jgi:quercetin dioxygenase-like cupin family protein
MFSAHSDAGYGPALPGIERKTLVHGAATLLTEFRMQRGSALPRHAHPYEQTGYLIRGRVRLSVGAEAFEAGPGDSWCIPAGVEHGAEVLEDALAIEVFSPVREDYLPR